MFFNPTDESIEQELALPLYYTGCVDFAAISWEDKSAKQVVNLNRDYSISITVGIFMIYLLIRKGVMMMTLN